MVEYDGSKGYKALLLNYEDHTFAKVQIDTVSLDFFMKKLAVINEHLNRELIWNSLYQMVRDAKIQTVKFVDIVLTSLASEPADSIVETVLDDVETAIDLYTPSKFRSKLHNSIFNFIYGLLPAVPVLRENRITIVKSKMNNFASSKESIMTMVRWLKN